MRKQSKLPIDELNVFQQYIEKISSSEIEEMDPLEIEDTLEDLLVMAYVFGTDAANEDLETNIDVDIEFMDISINKTIADKTWRERLREAISRNDNVAYEIQRIAETESHRIYNEAMFDTAVKSGLPINKKWVTMLDNKVRETHDLLEGVSVKLDERFYTNDGDSALMPGGFERADNNINCRCELKFFKDI